jgi:hypothetical protein
MIIPNQKKKQSPAHKTFKQYPQKTLAKNSCQLHQQKHTCHYRDRLHYQENHSPANMLASRLIEEYFARHY